MKSIDLSYIQMKMKERERNHIGENPAWFTLILPPTKWDSGNPSLFI